MSNYRTRSRSSSYRNRDSYGRSQSRRSPSRRSLNRRSPSRRSQRRRFENRNQSRSEDEIKFLKRELWRLDDILRKMDDDIRRKNNVIDDLEEVLKKKNKVIEESMSLKLKENIRLVERIAHLENNAVEEQASSIVECNECRYESRSSKILDEHMKRAHENPDLKRCIFNNRGHCRYGTLCNFRHYSQVCPENQDCKKEVCEKRHPVKCRYGQSCPFGHNCSYHHIIEGLVEDEDLGEERKHRRKKNLEEDEVDNETGDEPHDTIVSRDVSVDTNDSQDTLDGSLCSTYTDQSSCFSC